MADLGFLEGVQVQAGYCSSTRCYIVPGKGSGSKLVLVTQKYSGGVIRAYAEVEG